MRKEIKNSEVVPQIKLFLVDDHKIFLDSLKNLIESHSKLKVVGSAYDGQEAIAQTRIIVPDIIIMDIAMPNLNGIEATKRIKIAYPTVKVIALSMSSHITVVREMLKAGASGYLLKEDPTSELINAIFIVYSGEFYFSPKISHIIVSEYLKMSSQDNGSAFFVLTEREREVLQLLTEGKNVKEVAHLFNLSTKTIESHKANIMRKLNIFNIAELTKYAIKEGITNIDL